MVSKTKNPMLTQCPVCQAQPNERCVRETLLGKVPRASPHRERNPALFPSLHKNLEKKSLYETTS